MPPLLRRRAALSSFLGVTAASLAACGPREIYSGGQAPVSESPDSNPQSPPLSGRLLYVADSDLWLWSLSNAKDGAARRLTRDRITRQPAWSPDGKKIAHVKLDVSSSELWLMDADGANQRQLTDNYSKLLTKNNWAFRPTWWPDGSRLLFLTEATTNDLMIWQIQADGKNPKPYVTVPDFEGGLDMPAVSPDAKRLLAVTYRTPASKSQIFAFALPGGPWRQLTDHPDGAYDPVWSPDGTRFAYTVRTKARHDLWVAAPDGSSSQPVTDSGACRAPCWSPDGQQLAYISGESGPFDIFVKPLPLGEAARSAGEGKPRQLTRNLNVDAVSGLSWTK